MNVVILSNSYGEDRSGALIAKELRKLDSKIRIRAFPLISLGEEYEKRNIKVIGGHPPPPSGGFLLKSVRKFLADIAKVFFLPFSYIDRLRVFKYKTDIIIVVGDFSLLFMGYVSLRKKAYFLEQCKSNYIHPHLPLERFFMREIAEKVFTHDKITADDLKVKGIDAKFAGNPMMDGLTEERKYSPPKDKILIGLLPGSRKTAYNNMKRIAEIIKELTSKSEKIHFAVALSGTVDKEKIAKIISDLKDNIDVCYGSFVDIVKKSKLVISLGGTASEQSLYLGTPVVSFPGSGAQNSRRRLNGQKKLLGEPFVLLDYQPKKIAEKILALISNQKQLKNLGEKGKKRAGNSGGAKKIAQYIYSEEVKIKKSIRESRRQSMRSQYPLFPQKIKTSEK
jgi:uncharacterized protein (TIGR03492 family)